MWFRKQKTEPTPDPFFEEDIIDGVYIIRFLPRFLISSQHKKYEEYKEQFQKKMKKIAEQYHPHVIFSLPKVEHINSLGLGLIVEAMVTLKKNGGKARLCCCNDDIMEILHLTKLYNFFEPADDEEWAIKRIKE